MRIALALVVSLSIASSARADDDRRNILVWNDATFYVEPSNTAPRFQVARFDGLAPDIVMPREVRRGHVMAMRLLDQVGEFFEVTPERDPQCAFTKLESFDVDDLRLFVKVPDMARVIAKPWSATFPDGTSVTLGIGTPVHPIADDYYSVVIDGYALDFRLPADVVDVAYVPIAEPTEPTTRRGLPKPVLFYSLPEKTIVKLDGQSIAIQKRSVPSVALQSRPKTKSPTTTATINDRCSSMKVLVPTKALVEDMFIPYGTGRSGLPRGGQHIKSGSELWTTGGRRLGRARQDLPVNPRSSARSACTEVEVTAELESSSPTGTKPVSAKINACAAVNDVYERASGWGTLAPVGGAASRSMPAASSSVPTVRFDPPTVQGDLDKAIIRRHLKRQLAKLQYCYEKELLGNTSLAGQVTATWTITGDGKVIDAAAAGVDPAVASCVQSVIEAIEFPKPRGRKRVTVRYPLTFRSALAAE